MFCAFTQNIRKHQIRWGYSDARIHHEQANVSHIDSAFGQAAHPALQTVVCDVFQPGRVNNCKTQICQTRSTLAQIACDTGLIVDQRQTLANQAVEQC